MRKADERIVHMAHHDALTGLPNRVAFRRCAEGEIAALLSDGVFAVMCLDLDQPELRVSYGIEAVIGFGGRGLI